MSNPLISKLTISNPLTDGDRTLLQQITSRARLVEPRQDLIRENDRPDSVHLVLEGWACRYKLMPEGRRHIVALLVPGDFCDLHVAILGRMDHTIAALTPCRIVTIPRAIILELSEKHPRIARALWWATLVDEGILREWLANLGQREADQRLAHLFCELLLRLQVVGQAAEKSYAFPLIQTDLADLLGLSTVHANRTLQSLRSQGLIVLRSKQLEIPDVSRLRAFCDFDPNYLHLSPRQEDDDVRREA